jgi:hypothetical protein
VEFRIWDYFPAVSELTPSSFGFGFGICDVRFGMYDLGCTIWDVRFGMYDLGCAIWDLGCTIWDLGCMTSHEIG